MRDEEKENLDEFGVENEGFCYACGDYGPIDDLSLCKDCSGKMERDLIRLRDWDRSCTAWTLKNASREKLRKDVIKKFGVKLELLVDESKPKKKRRKR